jgi:uroporphyrinogen-III synthase
MSLNDKTNKVVLISTRPDKKNIFLLKDLVGTNISLLNFPLTEISELKDYNKFDLILSNLKKYQHIIFISTNAVYFFIERFKNLSIKLPKQITFSCIGPSTQEALQKEFNIDVHFPKETYDSKSLMNDKIFNDIRQKNILIIRGKGGREVLKNKLIEKGAKVDYGECYIRNYLPINFKQLKTDVKSFSKIYLLITSHESAKHFLSQNNKQSWGWLKDVNIIVNHQRTKKTLSLISDKIYVTNDITGHALSNLINN